MKTKQPLDEQKIQRDVCLKYVNSDLVNTITYSKLCNTSRLNPIFGNDRVLLYDPVPVVCVCIID